MAVASRPKATRAQKPTRFRECGRELDSTLRQRQRLQAGGLEGTEVFHYAGPSDSPSWTERGSTWTRSIPGIGGELSATQESGKEVELLLDEDIRCDVDPETAGSGEALRITVDWQLFADLRSIIRAPAGYGDAEEES